MDRGPQFSEDGNRSARDAIAQRMHEAIDHMLTMPSMYAGMRRQDDPTKTFIPPRHQQMFRATWDRIAQSHADRYRGMAEGVRTAPDSASVEKLTRTVFKGISGFHRGLEKHYWSFLPE